MPLLVMYPVYLSIPSAVAQAVEFVKVLKFCDALQLARISWKQKMRAFSADNVQSVGRPMLFFAAAAVHLDLHHFAALM